MPPSAHPPARADRAWFGGSLEAWSDSRYRSGWRVLFLMPAIRSRAGKSSSDLNVCCSRSRSGSRPHPCSDDTPFAPHRGRACPRLREGGGRHGVMSGNAHAARRDGPCPRWRWSCSFGGPDGQSFHQRKNLLTQVDPGVSRIGRLRSLCRTRSSRDATGRSIAVFRLHACSSRRSKRCRESYRWQPQAVPLRGGASPTAGLPGVETLRRAEYSRNRDAGFSCARYPP